MAKKTIKRKVASKGAHVRLTGLAARVALVDQKTAATASALPEFRPGDTVRVHVRIKEGEKERVQAYEGVVIARDNRDGGKSFNVRKISHGVGVERIFMENSPKIAKLEVVQKGAVRRAKLYYLRGLEGKAARVEREVETQAQVAQSAAAKGEKAAAKKA